MTTNSTKYFCNRGALSARFILVDTPLRDEYYYDGEHGKYYFGARYYDPFFGMWMSPDPASQFANPYSYGGDPLNYIDPTGMWAIGLGLVVGWDNKSGWSFGVGAAADFEIIGANFSYTFNQDGSKSLNLGVNANIPILTPWVYLEINMGLGFSMNSYSGSTLSTHGGLCVGYATACGGIENGESLYWDRGGSFMGATVYAGVYASLGYGAARVSAGYEAGLMGMEGRGLYAGANVGKDGASLYASWAENGGWNYGGQAKVGSWNYQGSGVISLNIMGYPFSNGEILSAEKNFHKEGSSPLAKASENGAFDESGYFVISGHGIVRNRKGYIQNQNITNKDGIGLLLSAEDIAQQIKDDPRYKSGTPVKLASCLNAVMAQEVSTLLPDTDIMGPTTNLVYGGLGLFKKGSQYLADGGSWNTYRNGKLVSSKKDGFWDRQWAWQ
jgi:RHS repeat-associated protein